MSGTARRKEGGALLRATMRSASLRIKETAERTREIDEQGVGISWQLLGFLHSAGESGRETCSPRSAGLIELALGVSRGSLFDYE